MSGNRHPFPMRRIFSPSPHRRATNPAYSFASSSRLGLPQGFRPTTMAPSSMSFSILSSTGKEIFLAKTESMQSNEYSLPDLATIFPFLTEMAPRMASAFTKSKSYPFGMSGSPSG